MKIKRVKIGVRPPGAIFDEAAEVIRQLDVLRAYGDREEERRRQAAEQGAHQDDLGGEGGRTGEIYGFVIRPEEAPDLGNVAQHRFGVSGHDDSWSGRCSGAVVKRWEARDVAFGLKPMGLVCRRDTPALP